MWLRDDLRHVRFSGGEPTFWPWLADSIAYCKKQGVIRAAVSTNGSSNRRLYEQLLLAGADDFSVSLDACCAQHGDAIARTESSAWEIIVRNIRFLAARSYVTVGVVITEQNVAQAAEIVKFAHDLGVADIRLVSAAQYNELIPGLAAIPEDVLDCHPILKYRIRHFLAGRNVRGIEEYDTHRCYLVMDDSAIAGNSHFPCIIYLREGGRPIGQVGDNMRHERLSWSQSTDIYADPICRKNCLDVCVDFNNRCAALKGHREH